MAADEERSALPFEPKGKRKKSPKAPASSSPAPKAPASSSPAKAAVATEKQSTAPAKLRRDRQETEIPEVVSRRMLRRMLFFSGIPVVLGIAVFFVSYIIIIRGIAELPNVAVLLTTLGCFGLSVVGLSYGALSSSWEEDTEGSWLGFDEFSLNFGRMVGSWRQAREERRQKS